MHKRLKKESSSQNCTKHSFNQHRSRKKQLNPICLEAHITKKIVEIPSGLRYNHVHFNGDSEY